MIIIFLLVATASFSMMFLAVNLQQSNTDVEQGASLVYNDGLGDRLAQRPHFDLVALIYMTASEEDVARYEVAKNTWLQTTEVLGLSFAYVCAVCADDPDVSRVFGESHVAVVPCEHGYKTLSTKGIEGYRYISRHFTFDYVLKSDIDTMVPLECVARSVLAVNRTLCSSFGMGHWFGARSSKVWSISDVPYGPKFHNEEYLADTGNEFYNSYPSGWAIIWSGDVARFLGMFGRDDAPRWRRTWTIDDAAMGTFIVGLDVCQLGLPCHTASDLKSDDMHAARDAVAEDSAELPIDSSGGIEGFQGPFDDDVPGLGDIGNVHANSLGNCAARCKYVRRCVSFEYSPSADWRSAIRNCQLASARDRSGVKYGDYVLYLKS